MRRDQSTTTPSAAGKGAAWRRRRRHLYQSKVFQHLQEATGQVKISRSVQLPDWTIQVANTPAVITCTDVMAKEHPELVIAYMKAMIKVGRWRTSTSALQERSSTGRHSTWIGDTTRASTRRYGAEPEPQNMECIKIGKDFMFSHGYIKHDFRCRRVAAPEFLEQAAIEVLKRMARRS